MNEGYKTNSILSDKDIIFSKSIRAGKRIYYFDVKKNKKNELYLAITESKKISGNLNSEASQFEKHKMFLYKEEFERFTKTLMEMVDYIKKNGFQNNLQNNPQTNSQDQPKQKPVLKKNKTNPFENYYSNEIKLDLDF